MLGGGEALSVLVPEPAQYQDTVGNELVELVHGLLKGRAVAGRDHAVIEKHLLADYLVQVFGGHSERRIEDTHVFGMLVQQIKCRLRRTQDFRIFEHGCNAEPILRLETAMDDLRQRQAATSAKMPPQYFGSVGAETETNTESASASPAGFGDRSFDQRMGEVQRLDVGKITRRAEGHRHASGSVPWEAPRSSDVEHPAPVSLRGMGVRPGSFSWFEVQRLDVGKITRRAEGHRHASGSVPWEAPRSSDVEHPARRWQSVYDPDGSRSEAPQATPAALR